MALIPDFNRIINLQFLSANYSPTLVSDIICPLNGRKPNIEIVGKITPDDILDSFNVTIKNLYLENLSQQYGKLRVTAGYKNQPKVAFTGSIVSIFPEKPSPEGSTVIQCISGNLESWLNKYINIDLPQGFTLTQTLLLITQKLGIDAPYIPSNLASLQSQIPLQIQDKAAEAIHAIKKCFPTIKIKTFSNKITVWDSSLINTGTLPKELKYLSAPPQLIAGEKGESLAWITAPWDPSLRPGDLIKINQRSFVSQTAFGIPRTEGIYNVLSIDFHFSTVGQINQMTILGEAQ